MKEKLCKKINFSISEKQQMRQTTTIQAGITALFGGGSENSFRSKFAKIIQISRYNTQSISVRNPDISEMNEALSYSL